MKLYLAGTSNLTKAEEMEECDYFLESILYIKPWQYELIGKKKGFILDSGAFTYMTGKDASSIDWREYAKKYADFIRLNNVLQYMEIDIDSVVGYEKVKEIRKEVEDLTGLPCIPVWHKKRGLDEFKKLSIDYDYIAIGGIASGEISRKEYKFLPNLIKIAKNNGARVHGLGFTVKGFDKYGFYSVDSTSWSSGGRYGDLYVCDGSYIHKVNNGKPIGKRLKNKDSNLYNLGEWCKLQKILDNER